MKARRKRRLGARYRIGRVSVYEHHGAWWVYYRDRASPVRRRIGASQEEADRIAAQVNSQVANAAPTLFSFQPIGLGQLRGEFLAHHEDVLRSSLATIRRYSAATQHLLDYFESLNAETSAHEVSASGFIKFLRERVVSPNGHPNSERRPLRDKGLQYIVQVCRSLYAFARKRRHLPPYSDNPFADLQVDRMRIEDAKPIFVFDEASELAFLSSARNWEFPIHLTLAKTGMRPGELCHLLIEELDLKAGWLHIRNKPDLGWSVKTRSDRSVPLVPELVAVLRAVVGSRSSGPLFIRPQFKHGRFLTNCTRQALTEELRRRVSDEVARTGRSASRRERSRIARSVWRDAGALKCTTIRNSFVRIAHRCGLDHSTCPKSWRHTFATLLQDANVDPLLRQITLGHKPAGGNGSLGMTSVYTHSRPETQKREIARAISVWSRTLQLAIRWIEGGVSC